MFRTTFTRLLTLIASLLLASLYFAVAGQPALTESASVSTGSTGKIGFIVTHINLQTNDIIYDPVSGKIYASTPSTAAGYGNSIVPIDVPSGAVGTPIYVGSEPNKLALSDDGQYLYVGLDGAAAVRRVNVISQTAELQFSLGGTATCGAKRAEDMVVLQGNPNAVAISLRNSTCDPRHEGVAIYDDGVRRPTSTPGQTGSNVIEPSNSASTLYGYNNEGPEFSFRVLSVTPSGVVETSATPGLMTVYASDADIRFDKGNGLIYATNGVVIDPAMATLEGTYAAMGLVYPDSSAGLVYFFSPDYYQSILLTIFDQATFTPVDNFTVTGVSGTPTSLIKAGENLFAFRTSEGQVYFVKLFDQHFAYLPLLKKACSAGICGRVTVSANAAQDTPLELRFFDGAKWSTRATTYTDERGYYAFTGMPGLAPGQRYYVRFYNNIGLPSRLWIWGTRVLTSYSAGSNIPIGDFDIADITLWTPGDGAMITLPFTFDWTPRYATPSDTYEFNLYDPTDGDPYFFTDPPLGFVGTYVLKSLPPGFSSGVQYVWEIWVYSPDGGYGISYDAYKVWFSNAGMSVTAVPQSEREKILLDWENRRAP